jgi:hypothetical protein
MINKYSQPSEPLLINMTVWLFAGSIIIILMAIFGFPERTGLFKIIKALNAAPSG